MKCFNVDVCIYSTCAFLIFVLVLSDNNTCMLILMYAFIVLVILLNFIVKRMLMLIM